MWSSRLFWKLFFVYVGLTLTLAIGFLVVAISSQRAEINRQVEQRLLDTALVLRSHVTGFLSELLDANALDTERGEKGQGELQDLVKRLGQETGTRLTLVDSGGRVLADSDRDPRSMMNHASRQELIAAMNHGKGTATRPSPTLGIDMYYLAIPVETRGGNLALVRVAVRLDEINQRVASLRRFIWVFVLLLGLVGTALTYTIVGRIIHPLAQLTERAQAIAAGIDENPVAIQSEDEIKMLAEAFNEMQSQLAQRFRQLRANNEQMSTVLSSMDEGIIAVDSDERILLANDTSKTLLSFTTNDEQGRPLLEAVRSRHLQEIFQECIVSGKSVHTEFESSGEPRRDLSIRATCLPGTPAHGVVMVLHDITELRRLENLRHEFVANVSHELKTPLASIKAYAETLRLGAIHDPAINLKFVVQIEEQAERLHQLILDLLQIARVESGDAAFDISQVPVGQVVEACIDQHRKRAEQKQIHLIIEPPSELLIVMADEEGFRAILDNLVDNAIKYTPDQGRVTVRWWFEDAFGVIEVQDSGIGIAPEYQVRVFERFHRVDKARSREMGGTGLGLSIVKHLSQAFGGSVVLRSTPGEGSIFQVRLPLG